MTRNELRAVAASLAIALPIAGTGFALGLALKPITVTYELRHLDSAGELWIFDHGLSRDDCRAARSEYPAGLVFCAPSYSTHG